MRAPSVTVVVPFHDVEGYADDCVRSLLAQDFGNYEVVCVDDGSTDSTGTILDSWTRRDARVCVIHTTNVGLSEARNLGVRAARASLVTFVDGDDVVSPHYLSLLFEAHGGRVGRMVVGKAMGVRDGEAGFIAWPDALRGGRVLARNEAIREYLRWEIGLVAWGRLAPRELYLRIPFEPGTLYEDSHALPSHLSAVDEVILLDDVVYGHVSRKGSISNPHVMTVAHAEGKLATIAHLCDVALEWPIELRELAVWRLDRHLVSLVEICATLPDQGVARLCRRFARGVLAKDIPWVLRARRQERLSWRLPLACACAVVSPRLLHLLVRASRQSR